MCTVSSQKLLLPSGERFYYQLDLRAVTILDYFELTFYLVN